MQLGAACGTIGALLFFLPPSWCDDDVVARPSGERAKEYVAYLASDALQGRKPGAEGYREAADWVAERFAEWGLAPAGEDGTYFQQVPIRPYTWSTGVPRLSVGGREFLLDDEDFSLRSLSTPSTVSQAEVVFVGYGIAAPDEGLDEYAGLDVEGRVVLALMGSPDDAPAGRGRFSPSGGGAREDGDRWREASRDAAKIRTAHDRGAAAILLYDPEPAEDGGGRRYGRGSRSEGFEPERDFLCFTVSERVFRAIMKSDPQESPSGTTRRLDAIRRAIQGGQVRSAPTGMTVSLAGYDSSTTISGEDDQLFVRNVIAKIEGTDPGLKDQYVILGAHLDHVGMSDGYVRNGADDNASGAAVTMEVARTLAESGFKPKRTLVFCAWTAEEMGLIGSYHYADHPCDGVSMERVVAYFNADMVGLGDAIGAPGALNFPSLWEVIKKDQDPEILEIVQASTGGPGGSDHSAFIVRGIESLALMTRGGTGHPDYHQPEDDVAKIDPAILGKTCRFAMRGMMSLANETETELLIENRKQLYEALQVRFHNFNPALEGSAWEVVELAAEDHPALREEVLRAAARALREGRGQESGQSSGSPRSVTRGLADLGPFEGDLELLELAAEVHGFGRVDVHGDDGVWIVDGRLTEAGRAALQGLERGDFVVHLAAPGPELLEDFLNAASEPFLVTGEVELTDSMADRMVQKGVLLGVDFDPRAVDEGIARLERAKELVGRRDLLLLYLTSVEELDAAKQPLYLGLLEKGWAPREIAGSRRAGGGILGGNLGAIGAAPGRGRRY